MKSLLKWLSVAALGAATAAFAEEYPSRPVAMLVPYAAGGPVDVTGRVVAQVMSKSLGQTILVENRPSAGGFLAPELVKNAKPDGYTILIHHIGMATIPALYRDPGFDPLKDFEYIGLINTVPMTIVARGDFPAKDFAEFLAYIKQNSAKVTLANAGTGAASHLCGLLFMNAVHAEFLTVPYKGSAPAMNDLVGGHVDFTCDQTTSTTAQIKAGKVKAYAVTSRARVPSLPGIPTLQELGFKGFELGIWNALYAPKGTPKPVVDRLVHALQQALGDPGVKERFAELGAEAMPLDRANPEALRRYLAAEIDRWRPILKDASDYGE